VKEFTSIKISPSWIWSDFSSHRIHKGIKMTKLLSAAAVAIAVLVMSPLAFGDQTSHSGVGTVRSVDRTKGEVTLTHAQISDHNMLGMTMDFTVRNKQLFDRMQPGKQVAFEFVAERTRNVITSVTPLADPGAASTPRKRNSRQD
jgi:Cu/Ag efflux protein CusF